MKTDDHAVAAGHNVDPAGWQEVFEGLMGRIASRFARVEPRRRVRQLILGLLADLPRKNCWTIAEHVGDATPDGLQHLLGRAKWDADLVRDDLRGFVLEHLADDQAVLVVDETGDLKKGTHTVGVQASTPAPRAGSKTRKSRCTSPTPPGTGTPPSTALCTCPSPGPVTRTAASRPPSRIRSASRPSHPCQQMIERALDAGVSAAWAAGDEVYGDNPNLRTALEARQLGYVLAVSCTYRVPTPAGPQRADHLAKRIPRRAWQKLSAGRGAKGHRWYDWALVAITTGEPTGHRHLMIRRKRSTGELAYYRCYSPRPVPLSTLVKVAGSRWTVEETFQSSKGLAGLDEHQVRRWDSWHRWVTLALLAHAFLAVTTALERRNQAQSDDGTSPDGLVPLTCNEIQRLFTTLIAQPARDLAQRLRWSTWRRRHQARARHSHYRRQAAQP
ncbi:IS701 family transposase [Actinopolymorpha alba]|uniref:IS701 family transposase n=1 Tax=Actinopolymorpha alba TaxID=533267 RepID=UPI003B50B341